MLFLLKRLLLFLLPPYYRYIENPHSVFHEILIYLIFFVILVPQGKELLYCSLMLVDQPQVVIYFHPCRKVCWSFSSALPHLLAKEKMDWENSHYLTHCFLGARDRAQEGEDLAINRFSTYFICVL